MKTISEMKKSINEADKKGGQAEKSPPKKARNASENGMAEATHDTAGDIAENEAEKTAGKKFPDKAEKAVSENNELIERIKAAEAQRDEIMDKYQRALAEFDNFRKRTSKEKAAVYADGVSDIIKSLLPVFDSFDRALSSVPDSERESPSFMGLNLIYKQLRQFMEQNGITEIEAVGKQFDPVLHQALVHADDPERGENEIVEELQKGYMLNEKIIRHSMVKVVN